MTAMANLEYGIALTAPGFIGDAFQRAEWRVPPIKAAIRQFWRIVVAKDCGYDWRKVREREAYLFGHAWLDEGRKGAKARRSRVTIALDNWSRGDLEKWSFKEARVRHPEVKQPVGAQLYLGYGPLNYDRDTRGTGLKRDTSALRPDADAVLRLRVPEPDRTAVERAIELLHWFGALGGRSRNGWGSVVLRSGDKPLPAVDSDACRATARDLSRRWSDCLELDWPHAIGADERGPLVWRTGAAKSWEDVVRTLAEVKIAFRTQFRFPNSRPPHPKPLERHVLAYPVTKHSVEPWRNNARLANQIRFKIVPAGDRRFRGIVSHFPAAVPRNLRTGDIKQLEPRVWPRVHEVLDRKLERVFP